MKNSSNIRNHILKTARDCFSEQGYSEATMRDIAKKANISVGNIYYYYKSKQELFDALNMPEAADIRPEYNRKRQNILHKALMLFGEKGFDRVTMDEIATELKISKASLYQYCTSKEDLFSQILQNSSFNLYAQNIAQKGKNQDIRHVIKSIGNSYLQIGDTPERLALFKAVIRDSSNYPELGTLYYEQGIKPACNNIVNYILDNYGHEGALAQPLFIFVQTYIGTLQSYLLMNNIISGIPHTVDKNRYLDITTDIFLNYLRVNHYIT